MKTTFSRQFALIAGLLLVCMLITGVSFWFLMRSYVEDEKEQTLMADADAVSNLARAYNSAGELTDNWGFLMSLSFISHIGDAEALICDEQGRVILCSCEQFTCSHIGRQLDEDFRTQVEQDGGAFRRASSRASTTASGATRREPSSFRTPPTSRSASLWSRRR